MLIYMHVYSLDTFGGFVQAAYITDSIVSLMELALCSVVGVSSVHMGRVSFEQPK